MLSEVGCRSGTLGFVSHPLYPHFRCNLRADPTGAATGDTLAVQASYIYDDFGQLLEKHDANNKVTRYFYDSHGNQIRTEPPNGHIATRNVG